MKEEDGVTEGVYCSEQPLLDSGFIRGYKDDKFYALTSINTVEIGNLEEMDMFSKIS